MTSRVLDCDHVFDALTRGPFPSGGDDDCLVEDHLRACSSCARLAAALRPAVDVLHEATGADDLPRYDGVTAVEPFTARVMQLVETEPRPPRVAQPLAESKRRNQRSASRHGLLRRIDPFSIVVAGTVGLVLGILLAAPASRFEKPRSDGAQAVAAEVDLVGSFEQLNQLNLVAACREPGPPENSTPPVVDQHAAQMHYSCCTKCHRVDQPHAAVHGHSIARLLQGCMACHESLM